MGGGLDVVLCTLVEVYAVPWMGSSHQELFAPFFWTFFFIFLFGVRKSCTMGDIIFGIKGA